MRNLARIILICAGAIWGIGFIGNKFLLDSGWTDLQLLFVRFMSAFVFVLLFYGKRILKANKELRKQGLFLGIFMFSGFFFQTWGLELTSASNNAIITAGYIIILPMIVYFKDKVKIKGYSIIAAILTFLGIVTISFNFETLSINLGDVLTFIGAMFWAIQIYYLSHQTKKHDLFALMGYQLLLFAICITTFMFIVDGLPQIDLTSKAGQLELSIGVLLGFFASFLAFMMQSFGQKHTSPEEASILISTESVFGPIFAVMIYHETLSIHLVIGAILVFVGLIVSELHPSVSLKKKQKVGTTSV
ncbi:MAG: DMT family transporter [Candidatus Izemoplasmatales bacterium]